MADTTRSQPKWEGKVTAELKSPATADQIWLFFSDFGNLHKWYPLLDTCYLVEGEVGQPGQVRYCGGTIKIPSENGEEETTETKWVKERLLRFDPVERCLSYEVADNNMGLRSYVATIKVVEIEGGGCRIDWSFVTDPMDGQTLEMFSSFINDRFQLMARKMEDAAVIEESKVV